MHARASRAAGLRWALVLGSSVYLGAFAITSAAFSWMPASGRPAAGLLVGSRVLLADEQLGTSLEQRRVALCTRPAVLLHGLKAFEMPLGDLGIEIDVARTMTAALGPGRTGSLQQRLADLQRARRAEIDVPLVFSIDSRKASAALARIAPEIRREPKDARLDLTAHQRIEEVPGEQIDMDATLSEVLRGVEQGRSAFAIATRPIAARITVEALIAVDISRVVSSYETHFQLWGEGAGRAVNIATASRSLDGTVLGPGQSFSFNAAVGQRTRLRGYTDAPEIVGDELQTGVGGGVCQVASTLYASALFGALEIQERNAHARPSSYTKLGLDATVSYPTTDLQFRNTLPFPVLLHVFLPTPTSVRAELLGGDPIAKVEYVSGIAKSQPFVRRVTRKPWFAPGRMTRHQKGIKGYSVYSLVRTTYADGRVAQRGYSSEYRPTPEVFWVSEQYDEDGLPPLPEGASGVEGAELAAATPQPSG
jgi:vancomycin resistance protein YoaR